MSGAGFDLTNVLQQAASVTANAGNEGGNQNRIKLIYPQPGTIKLRVLFNPKSGTALRKIVRHEIGGVKLPCMSMYNQECEISKALTEIKSVKGVDLFSNNAKTRGLASAIYISSNYRWDKPEDEPKKGERIWFMFPWTVYKNLNGIITDAGTNAQYILATNKGKIINVTRTNESNRTDYSATLDAFEEFQCCATDEEFFTMLSEWDDLNSFLLPSQPNDEMIKSVREAAMKLREAYFAPSYAGGQHNTGQPMTMNQFAPQPPAQYPPQGSYPPVQPGGYPPAQPTGFPQAQPPGFPVQTAPVNYPPNQQYAPNQVQYPPQGQALPPGQPYYPPMGQAPADTPPFNPPYTVGNPPVGQPAGQPIVQPAGAPPVQGMPTCFGQHGKIDPNQCLVCPHEVNCTGQTS